MQTYTLEERLKENGNFEYWELVKGLNASQRTEKIMKIFWQKFELGKDLKAKDELIVLMDIYYWILGGTNKQEKTIAKDFFEIYQRISSSSARWYIDSDIKALVKRILYRIAKLWKEAKSETQVKAIFELLLQVKKSDITIRDEIIKEVTDHHFPFDRAGAAIRQAFQAEDFDQYKNLWKHLFNAWYRNTSLDHIPGIIEAVLPIQKALKASGLGMELRNHAPLLDWLEGQAEFVSKQYALVCLFIERAQSGSTTRGRKLQPCVGDFRISYLNDPFRVNIEYRLEPEMVPVPDDAELNKVMIALLESDLDTLLAHMNDFEEKYNVNFVLHCPQLSKF
jgi:hypothetical protein